MRVICSKCQFENQADPNASRVVCARCATIIDVAMGDNFSAGYGGSNNLPSGGATGNFGNPGSGNFGANYSSGYEQTIRPGAYPPAPTNRPQLPEGDVYATRIDDDFDDVLDIPRPNNQLQSYQYQDTNPAFDDVFSSPAGGYETMIDSRPADPYQQPNTFQQPNAYQQPNNFQPPNAYQQPNAHQANAYQQGNAYDAGPTFDQPNYGAQQQQDAEFMGWPVLPEDTTDPGIPPSSAFSKKSGLLKGALMLAAAAALLFVGYSWIFGGKKPVPKPLPVAIEENGGTDNVAVNNGGTTTPATGAAPVGPSGPSAPNGVKPVLIPPSVGVDPKATAKAGATILPPKPVNVVPPAPPVTKPPAVATAPASTTPNKGNITIQAGSYSDQGQATGRVSALKAASVDARVVTANIPGKGTWYRVQIGRFPSREAAASYANGLRGKGALPDFLVTPIN